MNTYDNAQLDAWRGQTLVGADSDKIGKVHDIYVDNQSGQPEWLSVSTGLFGSNVSFVPLAGTEPASDGLRSRWSKDQVKDAPRVDPDGGELTPEDEERLYRHYGVATGAPQSQAAPTGEMAADTGRDTSSPTTDTAMTRSEEELRVGKTVAETDRVRLRKWVETEHVTQTVPVAREEVRVEREPITDQNVDAAMDGPEISEEEHEMALHTEQVVSNTEVVPKERVKLDKEVVHDEQAVDADLRKERVEVEGGGQSPQR